MNVTTVTPPLKSKPRRKGTVVDTIVLHATAGSNLSGAVKTLRARKLGYNYLIDKDGSVHKCCPVANYTSHAGSSYGPHEKLNYVSREQYPNTLTNRALGRVGYFKAGCSVNAYTIGISLVNLNNGTDPYTDAQYASVIGVIRELRKQFPALVYVTTHAIVSPGRKTDPKNFDVAKVAHATNLQSWRYAP